ncbi:MAG: ABC transporter permease, partial [Myxococcota bacterium]|nr:ABC transporter permease [Myxococcota bacterium]
MSQRARYLLTWPLANVRHTPWTSAAAIGAVAAAAYLAATLLGFVTGYQAAVEDDVDRLGYDLLITAKGCPYEAATLMLRGGVGLQYMASDVVTRLRKEAAVSATFPMLIHPIKSPGDAGGMTLLKGVDVGWRASLDLQLVEGEWYEEGPDGLQGEGVVLGFEAAELQQRHAGDPYLLYNAKAKRFDETTVRGILARTGTQVDGTVLLPIQTVQRDHDLPGKLTGVGVQLSEAGRLDAQAVRDRYEADAALQVIPLSSVVETLRAAMANLRGVVRLLSGFLVGLAGVVLVNTALVRALAEHQGRVMLHAIGFSEGFIGLAALVENLVLV